MGSLQHRKPALKIAVTGASGFIGRHVLMELAHRSMDVIAVTRSASRLSEVADAVDVVEMDITQADAKNYERLGKPDVLIHLAWDGLPNYKSLHHFEIELPNQYRFLKTLVEAGLPSLIVTGTCFEYGMQSGALTEALKPAPSNPYGYAKDALRQQLELLRAAKPFSLTWTRLFYMYGDGQSGSSLLPQLRDAVARGDKIFNMSGGEQLRDYLPVSEVARLIVELALRRSDHTIVNVCAGEPVSVKQLVEGWLKQNDWRITLNLGHYAYPDYEPMAFWGDSHRLDTLLRKA
jgi:nucleoside-diphosphate-sugar epimerase